MRKLALGLLLLAALAAPVAHVAPADAARPVALRLIRIVCFKTEDGVLFGDEAYLQADGTRIWGPTDIREGDERSLLAVPLQPFRRSIDLALFDDDAPDADDHLGTVRISRNAFRAGVQTATFTLDGANYTVTYKVVK